MRIVTLSKESKSDLLNDLLKRSEITIDKLKKVDLFDLNYDKEVNNQAEIQIKYEGYIKKIVLTMRAVWCYTDRTLL